MSNQEQRHGSKSVDNSRLLKSKNVPDFSASLILSEVLTINTCKFFFIANLYLDENHQYSSDGFIRFSDNHTLYFSMDAGRIPDVRNKCLAVAKTFACLYNGRLLYGKKDKDGRFVTSDRIE